MEIIFELLVEIFFEIVFEGIGALILAFFMSKKIPLAVKALCYAIIVFVIGILTYLIAKSAYHSTGIAGCIIVVGIGIFVLACIIIVTIKKIRDGKGEMQEKLK